jgi:hypothetical protein
LVGFGSSHRQSPAVRKCCWKEYSLGDGEPKGFIIWGWMRGGEWGGFALKEVNQLPPHSNPSYNLT